MFHPGQLPLGELVLDTAPHSVELLSEILPHGDWLEEYNEINIHD